MLSVRPLFNQSVERRASEIVQGSETLRTFLLSVFWISTFGSVVQLLILFSACWIIFSGAYSFSELNFDVFLTQYIPMFLWIKALIVTLLGNVGHWVLTIPVLVISPFKLVAGTIIGLWAFSAAKKIPATSTHT